MSENQILKEELFDKIVENRQLRTNITELNNTVSLLIKMGIEYGMLKEEKSSVGSKVNLIHKPK